MRPSVVPPPALAPVTTLGTSSCIRLCALPIWTVRVPPVTCPGQTLRLAHGSEDDQCRRRSGSGPHRIAPPRDERHEPGPTCPTLESNQAAPDLQSGALPREPVRQARYQSALNDGDTDSRLRRGRAASLHVDDDSTFPRNLGSPFPQKSYDLWEEVRRTGYLACSALSSKEVYAASAAWSPLHLASMT